MAGKQTRFRNALPLPFLLSLALRAFPSWAANALAGNPSPCLAIHGQDPVDLASLGSWGSGGGAGEKSAPLHLQRLLRLSLVSCDAARELSGSQDRGTANRDFIAVKLDRELKPALDDYLICLRAGAFPLASRYSNHLSARTMRNSVTPSMVCRRIHLYGVGLPKSGTASLAQLFSGYRSAHEPENREFMTYLNRYLRNEMSEVQMRRLLWERDRKFRLEVDSSHFYVYVVELLAAMYPHARFVLTIREPISWLRSFINDTHGFDGGDTSSVWNVYRDLRMRTESPHPAEEKVLADAGLYSLDGYFSYWRMHIARVLDAVPSEQLFVVPTSELSNRLQELADFAGVPLSSLRVELSHSHKAARQLKFVDMLDPAYLARTCLEICSESLEQWLPDDHARLAQLATHATSSST